MSVLIERLFKSLATASAALAVIMPKTKPLVSSWVLMGFLHVFWRAVFEQRNELVTEARVTTSEVSAF